VEEVCDRVLVLRQGLLVDSVHVSHVRQQHRITARLTGSLTQVPAEFAPHVDVTGPDSQGDVRIVTRGDLAPLLSWLSQQPLAQLSIEPVGLRTVYERHHPVTGE
jgi:ABC-2 type transport system ATP-binding protein